MKLTGLLILVFMLLCPTIEGKYWDYCYKSDDCGRVVGWVVDPESGEPVQEKFTMEIYRADSPDPFTGVIARPYTDDEGFVAVKIKSGSYYLRFYPMSKTSKYARDPEPLAAPAHRYEIKVEKGKMTEFRKKAFLGGSLKIILEDIAGKRINPQKLFLDRSFDIVTSIECSNIGLYSNATTLSGDDLDDGEVTVCTLFPEFYSIEASFFGLGYGDIEKENIKVEKEKTTVVKIVIDPDDITGIEGKVLDKNGVLLKNARVYFGQVSESIKGIFEAYTDKNGYYQLTAMPAGFYKISVTVNNDRVFFLDTVEIKKNIVVKKDMILNWSSIK